MAHMCVCRAVVRWKINKNDRDAIQYLGSCTRNDNPLVATSQQNSATKAIHSKHSHDKTQFMRERAKKFTLKRVAFAGTAYKTFQLRAADTQSGQCVRLLEVNIQIGFAFITSALAN